jgi:hypothetical protein
MCPCTGIVQTQASTALLRPDPNALTSLPPQAHMRQRTNAQALVRAFAPNIMIMIRQIACNPCQQVPIPCGSSSADVHLAITLNMTVSYALCPICENVPACSATGGSSAGRSDYVDDEKLCGMEFASESPPVPVRTEPRFMAHLQGHAPITCQMLRHMEQND